MKTLILDTSTEKSFLALVDGEKILCLHSMDGGPTLSKRLALDVSLLLKQYNFRPDEISLGEGPGSFTGIRVGAALAKALSFGWKIPLRTFCTLKVFIPSQDGSFAVLIDARMNGIHMLKGSRQGGHVLCEAPLLLSPDAVKTALQDVAHIVSPHPHLIAKRLDLLDLKAADALQWRDNF